MKKLFCYSIVLGVVCFGTNLFAQSSEVENTRSFITFEKVHWQVSGFEKQKFGYGNVVARLVDRIKVVGLGTYGQTILKGYLVFHHVGPGWAGGDALMYKIQPIPSGGVHNLEITDDNYIRMENGSLAVQNQLKDTHLELLPRDDKPWNYYFSVYGEEGENVSSITPYSTYTKENAFSFYIEKDGKKMYSLGELEEKDDTIILHSQHKITSEKKTTDIQYKIIYDVRSDKFYLDMGKTNQLLPELNQYIQKYGDQVLKGFANYSKNRKSNELLTWNDKISKDIYNALYNPSRLRQERGAKAYKFNFGGNLVGKSYGSGTVSNYLLQIQGSSGHYATMVNKNVMGHATLAVVQGRFWGTLTIEYH